MRFSKDHVWVRREGSEYVVGLTDYAQDELGEIAYVELQPPGSHVGDGEPMGSIESLKSSSDIYAPFNCVILTTNQNLAGAAATMINRDPSGEGWIVHVRADSDNDFESLMDEAAYEAYIGR